MTFLFTTSTNVLLSLTLIHTQMDFKEMLFTALAVAVGFVLGSIILSKLPTSLGGGSQWEAE
jgi:hypothetical protein